MDRRVTPPKQVTSATRGPPPSCKQALRKPFILRVQNVQYCGSLKKKSLNSQEKDIECLN